MQGFVMRVNPLLDPLSRSGLKQPVNGGGCVEDNHPRSPAIVAAIIVSAVIVPVFFPHVLLAAGGQYRFGRQRARAYADARVALSKLAARQSL